MAEVKRAGGAIASQGMMGRVFIKGLIYAYCKGEDVETQ